MVVYTLKRNCLFCKKLFLIDHPRRVLCSLKCFKAQLKIWWKEGSTPEKRIRIKESAWVKKKELLLNLGGKCITCGNKDLRVLEFSHKDSAKKHPRLKSRIKVSPHMRWKLMKSEIELKRVILECANCHRIKTHEEFWKNDIIS